MSDEMPAENGNEFGIGPWYPSSNRDREEEVWGDSLLGEKLLRPKTEYPALWDGLAALGIRVRDLAPVRATDLATGAARLLWWSLASLEHQDIANALVPLLEGIVPADAIRQDTEFAEQDNDDREQAVAGGVAASDSPALDIMSHPPAEIPARTAGEQVRSTPEWTQLQQPAKIAPEDAETKWRKRFTRELRQEGVYLTPEQCERFDNHDYHKLSESYGPLEALKIMHDNGLTYGMISVLSVMEDLMDSGRYSSARAAIQAIRLSIGGEAGKRFTHRLRSKGKDYWIDTSPSMFS